VLAYLVTPLANSLTKRMNGKHEGLANALALECVSKMPEAHFRRLWLHFCVDFP
jgi:hypothetical protein